MKLAIDSCVMLAIFKGEPLGAQWTELLIRFRKDGASLVICAVVLAELANCVSEEWQLIHDLDDLGIEFDPFDSATCYLAGKLFSSYRKSGGPRERILPDFLVGAHAQNQTEGLITHDRGFMRRHFNFKVIDWLNSTLPVLGKPREIGSNYSLDDEGQ